MDRGTLGFSTARPNLLEINTPVGVVHGADAKPIFGQVSILSPSTLRISAYEGTLIVEQPNGERKTIAQGETYEATLVSDASGGDDNPPKKGVTGAAVNWSHVLWVGIPIVAAGFVSCWLYPESPIEDGLLELVAGLFRASQLPDEHLPCQILRPRTKTNQAKSIWV